MKIYTKTGDAGQTSLWGGGRVSKASLRVETYGEVDELASLLGVIIAKRPADPLPRILNRVQSELLTIASDLATPLNAPASFKVVRLDSKKVNKLEEEIDEFSQELPDLHNFILPSGTERGSLLHFARSICRRAERRAIALSEIEEINISCSKYLNRLSDWLFTLARWQNLMEGSPEKTWQIPATKDIQFADKQSNHVDKVEKKDKNNGNQPAKVEPTKVESERVKPEMVEPEQMEPDKQENVQENDEEEVKSETSAQGSQQSGLQDAEPLR